MFIMEVLTRLRALPQQQQRKAAAILGALVADAVGTAIAIKGH